MAMYTDGVRETVRLNRKEEKFRKPGAKNKTRVLGKMRHTTDPIKQMAIVNISDLVKVSSPADLDIGDGGDANHGWFDKFGWDHRSTIFVTPDGIIYRARLDVANSANGKILYYIRKINEAGRVNIAESNGTTQVPASNKIIGEQSQKVNTRKSIADTDSEGNALTDGQREFFS